MRFISVPRYGKWKTKSSTSGRTSRRRAMLLLDRVHDHRAVVGQRARVVGDDERAPLVGDVAEPARLDAEVGLVEEVEQRIDAWRRRADRGRTRRPRRERSRIASLRQRCHRNSSGSCCRSLGLLAGAPGSRRSRTRCSSCAHLVDEAVAMAARRRRDRSTGRTPTAASRLDGSRRSPAPAAAVACSTVASARDASRAASSSRLALRLRRRVAPTAAGGGGASLPSPVANGSSPRICLPAITPLPSPAAAAAVASMRRRPDAEEVVDRRLDVVARRKAHHAPAPCRRRRRRGSAGSRGSWAASRRSASPTARCDSG